MLEPEGAYVPNDLHDNAGYRVPADRPADAEPIEDVLARVRRRRADDARRAGAALDRLLARGLYECSHGGHIHACAEGAHDQ